MFVHKLTAITTLLISTAINADSAAKPASQSSHNSKHDPESAYAIEEVQVFAAHPLSSKNLAQASSSLKGEELARKKQGSIGATLANEPGIHQSSFGVAASRPVIHGLSGPRVKVTQDRIDTLDVSTSSADHATTIEPFIAEGIEVLKGPSTLLYGSGAIGGVVNIDTGRIANAVPDKNLSGTFESRLSNNAQQKVNALKLNGGGGNIAWHIDGFRRDADNYEIPSLAESSALRATAATGTTAPPAKGELPGSYLDLKGGAVGFSYIKDRGFVGLAISRLNALYGLPGEHGTDGTTPWLEMKQTRLDIEAGLENPVKGFSNLNFRLGANNYEHTEFEASGEAGTRFDNDALEARIEIKHEEIIGWQGAIGLQYNDRDFGAIGEEAFIAPVTTRSAGLFWVAEKPFDNFDIETGLRIETLTHKPSGNDQHDSRHNAFSAALGAVIPLSLNWSASLHGDFSSRAPTAEELFSNGPHLTTQSYEQGNAKLDEERALGLSGTLQYSTANYQFETSIYRIAFKDYIYAAHTGQEIDQLPVFQYRQSDATFVGLEAQASALLKEWNSGELSINAMFDTLSAELDISGNDNIPRIPATRWGLGIASRWYLASNTLSADINYVRTREQDNIADSELTTSAYNDLRAHISLDMQFNNSQVSLFIVGRNLTDDEQRHHTSFIKDIAPAPGRTLEAGLRLSF